MSLHAENITLPLSIVIATLGGKELESTLLYLRSGDSVPDEILICIPEGERPIANIIEDACVRIVFTPHRGQVAQRAFGLAKARNIYVMQMDDDVLLPPSALADLYQSSLSLGKGNAISPVFKNAETNTFLTQYKSDFKSTLKSFSAFLIGGAPWGVKRMGKIDRSGIPYAIDPDFAKKSDVVVEAEWLPGGCVICHRTDLILSNYYPYKGKAYSEDVIHSLLWRQQGVRLWVATNVAVHTYLVAMPSTLKSIFADYRARAYVVMLNGGNLWRCQIWFLLYALRQSLKKIMLR